MTKLILIPAGGLGNQLFQLSFSLAKAKDSQIMVDWSERVSFHSSLKYPEFLDLDTQGRVTCLNSKKTSMLFFYCIKFFLHLANGERKTLSRKIINRFVRSFFISYLALRYRSRVNCLFDLTHELQNGKTNIVIGYFQDSKSPQFVGPDFFRRMFQLSSLKFSNQEKTLMVHIRRGDYLDQNGIGILTQDYFKYAILLALDLEHFKRIRIFSDSDIVPSSFIPQHVLNIVEVHKSEGFRAIEVLSSMCMHDGYVISNSSFSWWAAFIGRDSVQPVLAPSPWFSESPFSATLLPEGWNTISSNFEDYGR